MKKEIADMHGGARVRLMAVAALWAIFCVSPATLLPQTKTDQAGRYPGNGWNTWDIGRPNAMVHAPDGTGLELTLYDPETGKSFGRPFLRDVQHFGAHAPDGSYCFARYKQGGLTYEIEFAGAGNDLVAHVRPLTRTKYLLVAEVSFYFGRTGTVERKRDGLVVSGRNAKFYAVSPNVQTTQPGVTNDQRLVCDLSGDRWVTLTSRPRRSGSRASYQRQMDSARESYERARVQSGGFLADGAQAAVDAAAWNVVWNTHRDKPVATVAREWPAGSGNLWGGYLQGGWDSVFQALMADLESPPLAEATIRGLLADVTPGGYIPNLGTGWGMTEDHSDPPIVSFALLKFYKAHGRRAVLEEAFPTLYRWHQWWPTARDGNGNGLLEWGSNPIASAGFNEYLQKEIEVLTSAIEQIGGKPPALRASDLMNNAWVAKCESGLENSHAWDGVGFNKQTHTLEQDDVGLSSLYALDAWALAEIAHVLGRDSEEQKLRQDFSEMSARVNATLWSEKDGLYLNKRWDGGFNPAISLTNFYPLVAGIATPERARRMAQQYLLNPRKFWGDYILPVTPRDEPWPVEILGSTNYLVYEGLKRAGLDAVGAQVAAKSCQLFLKEWQSTGHIHETYNARTGRGEDMPSSTTYYAWGGLLPLIMVEELVAIDPWGSGLRFGSLTDQTASVHNVRIMNDSYDVFVGPGLRVMRNGQKLVETDSPIVLRNFYWGSDRVRFDVTAIRVTQVTLSGFGEEEKIHLALPRAREVVHTAGSVVISVDPQVKNVEIDRQK